MIFEYVLLGHPTALKRPRFTKTGQVYDSQKIEKLRDYQSLKYQQADKTIYAKRPLFMDPISIELSFFFEPPQSLSQKKKDALYGKPYDKHIDIDNLIKYILDVAIGVLYTDDKIVCTITAEKVYGQQSKTVFSITQL